MNPIRRTFTPQRRRPALRKAGALGVLESILTACLLTACVYDTDLPNPDTAEGGYTLNLKIAAGGLAARSFGHPDDKETKDESFINIDDGDYAVFIFDNDDNFLQRVEPGAVSLNQRKDGQGNMIYNEYTINGVFWAEEEFTSVQVMVLANWQKKFYGSYLDFEDKAIGKTLEAIYTNPTDFNFTMPTESSTDGRTSWVPSTENKTGIPMFGLAEVQLNGTLLETTNEIPMLRSLAKIEIVDMVPNGSANIEKCVLTSYTTTGRFIPDGTKNPKWNEKDTQVEKPSLPAGASLTKTNLLFANYKADENIEGTTYPDKDHFVVYIPEMDFEDVTEDEYPTIEVQINDMTYTIFLGNYNSAGKIEEIDGKKQFYEYILRNHSYRFDIISVGSTELDFVVETPWQTVDDDEWYYEDLKIGFESRKEFKWTNISEENYPSFEDGEEGTGFEEDGLLNPKRTIIISQDNWVEGAFTLSSPAKGTWTLALYGDDNTPNDQFRIDIKKGDDWEEGNDTYTGKVGEEVIFRIIPVAANNNTEHSRARVVLTCTSFDNQMLEANLPYYHFDNTGTEMPKPSIDNNDYFYVKQYYSGFGDDDE